MSKARRARIELRVVGLDDWMLKVCATVGLGLWREVARAELRRREGWRALLEAVDETGGHACAGSDSEEWN